MGDSPAAAGMPAASASLSRKRLPLLALLAANAVSQLGNQLTALAIPWFVLVTTGSAGKTALVGAVTTVPIVLAAFFGGALVDRLGYKLTSVAADVASGVTVALIPALHYTRGLAFWQLLVLVFLGAVLDAPGHTARQSLFPDLAALGQVALERANAAALGIWRLNALLGPPLAGVLIAWLSPANVLWLDAVSFCISALLTVLSVPRMLRVRAEPPAPLSLRGYVTDLAEGLRFIRRDRLIRLLQICGSLGNACGAALFAVALPVYALREFGAASALGLLLGGFGGGALLGVLLFGAFGQRFSRRTLFVGAMLVGTLQYWLLATTPPLAVGVAALVLGGLTAGPWGPIVMAVYQERVPADMRGRFFGTAYALDNATTPLAILLAGVLLERLSLVPVLVLIAAVDLLVALVALAHPALRDLDAPGGRAAVAGG